jgi:glycosyltransferase involved in cell wall biosynthesis
MASIPLVSIIVPSFNQGRFIRETLESCLAQDYRPLEVVVVDGASTDETIEVLKGYSGISELRWVSEPDSGVVEAVNKGLAMAQGEFAAIQSSDDCYLPGAVTHAVRALQRDPGLGFVFGDILKIDAQSQELGRSALGAFSVEAVLAVQTWIPQPSCFFRLGLARELGGWREAVPYAADTDLWFRMMLRMGGRKLDRIMAKRRMHKAQRDTRGDRVIRDYARMIADLFELYGAPEGLRAAADAGVLLQMNRYGYGDPESVKQERREQAERMYPPLAQRPRMALWKRAWSILRGVCGS